MSDDTTPPTLALRQMVIGYRVTQCLAAAAQLGVADLLGGGPKPVEELAAATGANADALYRVLRALASVGVFEEVEPRRFGLTPLAAALQSEGPQSRRNLAVFSGEQPYQAWGDIMYSMTTGAPAFNHVFGMPHFDYLAEHPEASATFNRAMSASSQQSADAIAAAYDFSAAETVVDVGGGQGMLITTVLRANPGLRGVLFDRQHVVDDAISALEEAGMADRCARIGGDFLASVPTGNDLYMLRHIIHDWDDERSITILRHCAEALAPGGKVLVVEMVIEEGNRASWAKFLDVHMLVMNGGRERTAEEYRHLFATAGLKMTRIIPAGIEESIIEGERA